MPRKSHSPLKHRLLHHSITCPQPNCRFNADANTGHGFAIFMASVGALRASRSGAG
jgi:hypothetical protein